MGLIERRDTPEDERMAAMQEAGWADVVWHQRDDGLRAFVRKSEADERLRGAVDLIRRFAEHDLPGNPPDALLDLFIAAEDFIREHDHPRGQ